MSTFDADLGIVGGSFGGVGAALAALEADCSVVLTCEPSWIGGQATSQGVSAFDEHQYIEQFGGTAAYDELRDRIRAHYGGKPLEDSRVEDPFDPGNCWVSRLAFEPPVGLEILESMLEERARASEGELTILTETRPVDATVANGTLRSVTLESVDDDSTQHTVEARFFLDATDLGELLPLADVSYVTGAESHADTGEPNAKIGGANPREVQGFTYCFVLEYRPGEDHTIEKPAGYERFRDEQPYTFEFFGRTGEVPTYRMFERGEDGEKPFWTFRRLIDAEQFPEDYAYDRALINWSANDYYFDTIIDRTEQKREEILDEARRLSLGFCYWLQTDAPRDDGGHGYPGLKLLPDQMGTDDGLSQMPYIRESRRIVPEERVTEPDVAAYAHDGPRGTHFPDSVGVGKYAIDVHSCVDNPDSYRFADTVPFQLPFRAMVPADGPDNLLPACKNIGTTHMTNGCYRLHPIEWAIGEAAAATASSCLRGDHRPADIEGPVLRRLQYRLLQRGVPLTWTVDVSHTSSLFVPTQLLTLGAQFPRGTPRAKRLEIRPEEPLTNGDLLGISRSLTRFLPDTARAPIAGDVAANANREQVSELFASIDADESSLDEEPSWAAFCEAVEPILNAALR